MDPIDFIDSKDIREHLWKIGYECDSVGASYLIYQSRRKTLAEKHEAWNWLIDNTPDTAIPKRNWLKGWDSLHRMLSDYMTIEDVLVKILEEKTANHVYIADSKTIFGNSQPTEGFQTCYENAMAEIGNLGEDWTRDLHGRQFVIRKKPVVGLGRSCSQGIRDIEAWFNVEGAMMDIDGIFDPDFGPLPKRLADIDQEIWNCSFTGMWFDIPIPFERGDVVRDHFGNIFVLEGTTPDSYRERGWSSENHGDESDINAFGMCLDCIYAMVDGNANYGDDSGPYLHLEYAKGFLGGAR